VGDKLTRDDVSSYSILPNDITSIESQNNVCVAESNSNWLVAISQCGVSSNDHDHESMQLTEQSIDAVSKSLSSDEVVANSKIDSKLPAGTGGDEKFWLTRGLSYMRKKPFIRDAEYIIDLFSSMAAGPKDKNSDSIDFDLETCTVEEDYLSRNLSANVTVLNFTTNASNNYMSGNIHTLDHNFGILEKNNTEKFKDWYRDHIQHRRIAFYNQSEIRSSLNVVNVMGNVPAVSIYEAVVLISATLIILCTLRSPYYYLRFIICIGFFVCILIFLYQIDKSYRERILVRSEIAAMNYLISDIAKSFQGEYIFDPSPAINKAIESLWLIPHVSTTDDITDAPMHHGLGKYLSEVILESVNDYLRHIPNNRGINEIVTKVNRFSLGSNSPSIVGIRVRNIPSNNCLQWCKPLNHNNTDDSSIHDRTSSTQSQREICTQDSCNHIVVDIDFVFESVNMNVALLMRGYTGDEHKGISIVLLHYYSNY
jgi:hypothetical protein